MKVIFLDKDGTLVKDVPYNIEPKNIMIETDVVEGLKKLAGEFEFIIISNQSGIARGYFSVAQLENYWKKLLAIFLEYGITIRDYFYCPHLAEGNVPAFSVSCNCRKPLPGLIYKAAVKYSIDLGASWMVGDILDDVQAGTCAGCKTVLIDNGNETEWKVNPRRTPDFIANDFAQVAEQILSEKVNRWPV